MSDSPINSQSVQHVAKLASLTMTEAEVLLYTKQLQNITHHIEQLDELAVDGVSPTFQVIDGTTNVFRDDEVKPSLTQAQALSQAKQTHQGYFVVPRILQHV